ncbi:cytochrome P450 [Mycena rebaudengoi]|nr:cytochrome P450 [Mycena rebaudengoi]
MPSLLLYGAIWTAVLLAICYRSSKSKLPLPPGPPKLPLVGNLFDMPPEFEWKTYMKWSKQYNSDIIHLDVAGSSIIVLNSVEAANDLLLTRSAIYSGRARMPMINELMGWDFILGLMQYGMPNLLAVEPRYRYRVHLKVPPGSSLAHKFCFAQTTLFPRRARRRLFQHEFNPTASLKLRPKVTSACHGLLRNILQHPDRVMDHLRHMAGALILSAGYGLEVLPESDPHINRAVNAIRTLSDATTPGKYLVDSLPILKYVPDWFPGAEFKRNAKVWRKLARDSMELPFAYVKREMASGTARPSFTLSCLRNVENLDNPADVEYHEDVIKSTVGTMFLAGADTTVSALGTFVLGMLSNPDAMRKAQLDIDRVVGPNRLPDFSDEPSLPYVSALVKEALRWESVTPFGIPHFVSVEDVYRGYRIPAGSIVVANSWAMSHDEVMYPDSFSFKPERFLLDGKLNPDVRTPTFAFGFGRRICPGRHMAMSSLWISIASILAAFDISKAVGEDGNVVEPSYEYEPGMVSVPAPFQCSIKPRSQMAINLIVASANRESNLSPDS